MMTSAIVLAALLAADPVIVALQPSAEVAGPLVRVGDIAVVARAPEGVAPHVEAVVVVLAREAAAPIAIERGTVARRLAEQGIPDVEVSGADVVIVRRARAGSAADRSQGSAPRASAPPPEAGPSASPEAARSNGELRVIHRGRFVEIAERGRPLRAGAPGDVIPVRLEGGRTIQARIERPGVAVPVAVERPKEAP